MLKKSLHLWYIEVYIWDMRHFIFTYLCSIIWCHQHSLNIIGSTCLCSSQVRVYTCSPLHLWDVACLEAATCLQQLWGLAVKQQVFIRQLHQNQPDQLTHVLPTDELLISTGGQKKTKGGVNRRRTDVRGVDVVACRKDVRQGLGGWQHHY